MSSGSDPSPGADRSFPPGPGIGGPSSSAYGSRPAGSGQAEREPLPSPTTRRRVLMMDDRAETTLPLRVTQAANVGPTSFVERLVDWVQQSGGWLAFGLAAAMTVAVAGAYLNGNTQRTSTTARGASAPNVLAPTRTSEPAIEQQAAPGTPPSETTPSAAVTDPETTTSTTQAPPSSRATNSVPRSSTVAGPTTTAPVATTTSDPTATTTTEPTDQSSATDPPTTSTEPEPTTTTTEPVTSSSVEPPATTPDGVVVSPRIRVEAESGVLHGTATVRSDHAGFSGRGFVGDILTKGGGVTLEIESEKGGPTPFTVRYSAGRTADIDGLRSLTVLVNGERITKAEMRVTETWSDWDVVVGELNLVPGPNKISFLWADGDTGWVNLDYVQVN